MWQVTKSAFDLGFIGVHLVWRFAFLCISNAFFCILLPFLCRLDSVFWLERDMKCVKFIDIIAFGERPANLSPCPTRMHGRDKLWFVAKVESCGPWVLRHLKISRPRHKTIMWHGITWTFDFLVTSQRLLRDARQWSVLELAWIYCALHGQEVAQSRDSTRILVREGTFNDSAEVCLALQSCGRCFDAVAPRMEGTCNCGREL